jgi:hypothetical protein
VGGLRLWEVCGCGRFAAVGGLRLWMFAAWNVPFEARSRGRCVVAYRPLLWEVGRLRATFICDDHSLCADC